MRWVPPSETKRRNALFRERLRGVDASRLVFVDESSTNVALAPRYGRAPKGERARGRAPRNRSKNVTLISSISVEGMGPSMSIEGSSDTDLLRAYERMSQGAPRGEGLSAVAPSQLLARPELHRGSLQNCCKVTPASFYYGRTRHQPITL
jgi:hypothetical protein